MKHPNEMVQIDILGPFYLLQSNARNYIISCVDDCSRKVAGKWSERKKSTDILDVLEEWIITMENLVISCMIRVNSLHPKYSNTFLSTMT
jgi:hypothetical protein